MPIPPKALKRAFEVTSTYLKDVKTRGSGTDLSSGFKVGPLGPEITVCKSKKI